MRTHILTALTVLLLTYDLPAIGQQATHTTFTNFPTERQLTGKLWWKSKDPTIDGLDLYADSLLLMRHKSGHPHHFSVMSVKRATYVTSAAPVGNQYGQSAGFISYGLQRNNLWVYDLMQDKIVVYNFNNTTAEKARAVREISVPVFYYSAQMINDSTLLASGDYDSPYKLSLVNVTNSKSTTPLTPYDPAWSRARKSAYESFLFLKPTADKCVLACRYADQIEVTDLTTRQSIIVNGPENYKPDVMEMTGNDGKELSARNESTRYAFVRGKVTNKYIYLLYSGNNSESSHLYYGKYLFVYDWKGTPVQKITLSSYAVDFAVTSDDAILYTYHPSSQSIEIASLQL
ncbi:MAG: hypothetical protein J7621_13460 [Niastella sp.]|nr:hypothetical protein [Niastella sp.]